MVLCGVYGWCAVVTVRCGMNILCAVVAVVNINFVWCAVVHDMWCAVEFGMNGVRCGAWCNYVVHYGAWCVVRCGAWCNGMNGVRCGGCSIQKSLCGALWWLSYFNCFFRVRGADSVGRVGMLSLFTASPSQFNQLRHWLNVLYTKIRENRIFAENRFFFVKKSAPKKTPRPSGFIPKKTVKILLPVEF